MNLWLGMKRDDGGEWTEEDAHCGTDVMGQSEPERASIHTPISQQNVGFKLLQKMGWKEGAGLGRNEDGGWQRTVLSFFIDYSRFTQLGVYGAMSYGVV